MTARIKLKVRSSISGWDGATLLCCGCSDLLIQLQNEKWDVRQHTRAAHTSDTEAHEEILTEPDDNKKESFVCTPVVKLCGCGGLEFSIRLYLSFPPTDWSGNKEEKAPRQRQHQATSLIVFTWLLMCRQEHNINQLGTNSFGARQTTGADQFLENSILNSVTSLSRYFPPPFSDGVHWGLTPAVRMAFRGQTRSPFMESAVNFLLMVQAEGAVWIYCLAQWSYVGGLLLFPSGFKTATFLWPQTVYQCVHRPPEAKWRHRPVQIKLLIGLKCRCVG